MVTVRTLLVEDHPNWPNLLKRRIRRVTSSIDCIKKTYIRHTQEFEEAEELLENEGPWHLLITDIGLGPRGSHEKLGMRLAQDAKVLNIPTLVVSGTPLPPEDVRHLILKFNAIDFFSKLSFDDSRFAKQVKKILLTSVHPPQSPRTKVFISYSHFDSKWLKRLQTYLKPLEREQLIELWDDTRIQPGLKWRGEIREAIKSARVAILLVSDNFLASDFILEEELPSLLTTAEQEGAVILPIIVSPCRYTAIKELSQFQTVNNPSKTLEDMKLADWKRVFMKVVDSIEQVLSRTDA